ncbi:DedA family protein [Aurantimicrobium minutum]|uniref:DedA family protein n=1 Tax=Aurantimicrobium minutum TaxID=708131 RepID=UPI002475A6EA|nr:DedA family protein [Aurantimicrobium minutum]MDH6206990.1 membrane-associated protein [Aurantimicrobium minutum]MDH6255717.1 membrane-associated protein [Aurantimicrobium minutum]
MLHASALDGQMADLFSHVGVVVFYLVVWGLVFAGTGLFVGAFIPFITGDSLLFAAGLVTAATPQLSIWILGLGVGIAAFVGDQVGFILGRHLGRPYLDRKSGPRMKKIIARVEKFYNSYGWWSVVIARFIPWARVFVPWVAGIGKMNYFKFLSSNFVGALAWGVGLTVVGYYAASIPGVKAAAYVIAGFFITASIIFSIRTWIVERRDRQQNPAN